jgi:site-specific recombinase XerD
VKRYTKATVIGLPAAEQVMAEHVAALRDRSYEVQCLNRGTIQRFLAYCRDVCEQPADRLLIDRPQLLCWLTQACKGVAHAYARQRLSALANYSRSLVRAGVTETDVMAEFKADHGKVGWKKIVIALRSNDPAAALAALRPIAPRPGPLAAMIGPYAQLRRSLGLKGYDTRNTLLDLDQFARSRGVASVGGVTPTIIEQWLRPMNVISAVRHRKVRCVTRFFNHLRTLRVIATNPVPDSLTVGRQRCTSIKPFIFTTGQVAAILKAAGRLPDSTRFPNRAKTCSTMLTMLCALGLRHGEVRRLRLCDIDLTRQTLFIDQTKFHKSRYVPFGPKVGRCLDQFLALRRTILTPVGDDDLLFVAQSRASLSYEALYKAFGDILRELKIAASDGHRPPRVHDLRHTFAVHRLLRWYREGVDVQSRLLSLSVFMGHVNVHSTQVYLSATGDLLQVANDRFRRHVASAIHSEAHP